MALDREKVLARFKEKYKIKDDDGASIIDLEDALDGAVAAILGYCNRGEIIEPLIPAIKDLTVIRFNQTGNEGEISRSEGGVSQTFEEGIPKSIKSQINKYRVGKARSLR